jgi:hypothetical protein
MGPRGEKGEVVNGGVSGYEVVRNSAESLLENGGEVDLSAIATCPVGKVLIGGGARSEGVGTRLVNNGPLPEAGGQEWSAFGMAHNESGREEKAVLWAIAYCVNA